VNRSSYSSLLGVFGIPADRLVDIDESGVHLYDANRRFGHGRRGQRIEIGGHSKNPGKRYNVLAAISIPEGVVARWVLTENSSAQVMLVFLVVYVLPMLQGPRVIMWDNASFHLVPELREAIEAAGHRLVQRPPYSPNFAPIESVFGKMKAFLKTTEVNEQTLEAQIYEGIDTITTVDVAGWFQHCHYFVEGRDYRPFLGD
jgi:transposase